jgi:hypothetical protein
MTTSCSSVLCVYDMIYFKCNYTTVLPKQWRKWKWETERHINTTIYSMYSMYQPTCTNLTISITVNLLEHDIFITALGQYSRLCFTSITMFECKCECTVTDIFCSKSYCTLLTNPLLYNCINDGRNMCVCVFLYVRFLNSERGLNSVE